jgi:predicted nucleic acid-binding Zn ribbon protein
MHRIGTTRGGNVLVELTERQMEQMMRACLACADVAGCGQELGLVATQPSASVAAVSDRRAVAAVSESPNLHRYCVVCKSVIGVERLLQNTCSLKCDKAKRKATHHATHLRRKTRGPSPVPAAAKDQPHPHPQARTCMICGKSLKGRSPMAKTCSDKCVAEKNRRYQRDLHASQTQRKAASQTLARATPAAAAQRGKAAIETNTKAAGAGKTPAPAGTDKARRLELIREAAARVKAAREAAGDLDDAAIREVRDTARRMEHDDME